MGAFPIAKQFQRVDICPCTTLIGAELRRNSSIGVILAILHREIEPAQQTRHWYGDRDMKPAERLLAAHVREPSRRVA